MATKQRPQPCDPSCLKAFCPRLQHSLYQPVSTPRAAHTPQAHTFMCRSLRPLTGPRWRTSSQGKATQFRAWERMGPSGPAWVGGNCEAERGGEQGSRDLLSIPRAASHKKQKLMKLAKDRKSHKESMQGLGLVPPLACPSLTHIHTGDETGLLWPPDMPHAGRQGRGGSEGIMPVTLCTVRSPSSTLPPSCPSPAPHSLPPQLVSTLRDSWAQPAASSPLLEGGAWPVAPPGAVLSGWVKAGSGVATALAAGVALLWVVGTVLSSMPGVALPSVAGVTLLSVAGVTLPSVAGVMLPSVAGVTLPSVAGVVLPSVAGVALRSAGATFSLFVASPAVAGVALPPRAEAAALAAVAPPAAPGVAVSVPGASSFFTLLFHFHQEAL